jgi:hypothetical protein
MKRYRFLWRAFLLSISVIGILVSSTLVYAQQDKVLNEGRFIFQWAFGAIKNTGLGSEFEVISRDTMLRSGDQIKFFLRLEKKCFVYLIYESSQGELSILFPYRFKLLANNYQISGHHYIPKGDQWFELDKYTGTEKFYLLASTERLNDLETLVNEYESAGTSKKAGLGKQILSEIRRLRKQHFKFKSYAEKPINIIGKMRGTEKTKAVGLNDLADHAVEISANNFFSRTFTIDHQ